MAYINQTNAVDNSALVIKLQNMESNAVLDIVMPLLLEYGMIPLTILDSFIFVESEAERIRGIFVANLTDIFGIAPSLHMDYIMPEMEIDEVDEPELWDDEFLKGLNGEEEMNDTDTVPAVIMLKRPDENVKKLLYALFTTN